MNSERFNDGHIYDSIVPTGTAPEPEISTIHQNGMEEETRYTSMPTCQPGMPPIQAQQCGMGSPVEHGVTEEPRYIATPTCQPGMTPLQPGNMIPPPPYSPKCYPPPAYYIAQQQQSADFRYRDQPYPTNPDHPGGPDVPKQSFVGPMVMSCIAFWFCGVLFGLIAWIVAVIGRDKPGASQRRRYATVSYMFSFIGIVTGIILIIVLCMTLIGSNPTCDSDEYYDSDSKKCCEYNRCWYGTSYYDGGCLKCCEYTYCGSYGFYLDSNGCKQCCVFSNRCHYGAPPLDFLGRKCCSSPY